MDLNLDESVMEEKAGCKDCVLCKYNNDEYLVQLQEAMASSTSKLNMYKTMYEAFKHRNTTLKDQNLQYIDINFIDFQIHFETHILSLRRIISQDIRLVKEMQDVLLSKMKNKNGLNSTACSTWMRLSAHKINLASKLKPPPRAISTSEKPYEFS